MYDTTGPYTLRATNYELPADSPSSVIRPLSVFQLPATSYELGGLKVKCHQGTSAVSGHQEMSGNPHQRSAKRQETLAHLSAFTFHLSPISKVVQ